MNELHSLYAFLLALVALATAVNANARDGSAHEVRLGDVQFEVACNTEAQTEFNRAMAYYHSFQWQRAVETADRVLDADSTCGMAHWLQALAMLDNPFVWPLTMSAKVVNEGSTLLDSARKAGLKTQRERDYVDTLERFLEGLDTKNARQKTEHFTVSLGQLAKRYPNDSEATVLYALFLSANFEPTDKTYRNQLHAAQLLEPIFVQ
ncbi:MAG: hypothetical protein QM706_12290 [Nitrospira sp.]